MAAGDKITEGMRILAALVAVAQDPTPLSALRAGPGLLDSLKKIAASPPASFARLAEDLGGSGAMIFAALPEKPRDAEVLYLQMVEAGLPDPARIMADRMDAAAVTEGMLSILTEPEHRDAAMQALFRALTQPALERLLADKAFAADLTPAFMRAVLENFAGLAAKLDSISRQGRDVLELLAVRFDIARVYDLNDAELREQLELRAADYRRFREQIEVIDERTQGLGNLKAAARDAAERLDFAEVEALLSRVDEVETEGAAETKILRADNALLLGRSADAFRILSAAADSFASVDQQQPAWRRRIYSYRLFAHGLRYGGDGLNLSEQMLRAALDDPAMANGSELWAGIQNNLGNVLQRQGERLGGGEGAALLGAAVAAYRAALCVWTEAAHPADWAMAQNNLGSALLAHGARLGGPEGAALVGKGLVAYRAALRVWTEAAHPVDWAGSQNNLGNALLAQGERLGGSEGAALFAEAVVAYRAALRVRTEAAHPVGWAKTMENLGSACESLAEIETEANPGRRLREAAACFEAALRVYDPETMRYNHDKVAADLARVRGKLAGLPDPA